MDDKQALQIVAMTQQRLKKLSRHNQLSADFKDGYNQGFEDALAIMNEAIENKPVKRHYAIP